MAPRIAAARRVVERLAEAEVPVYGLTTGLGAGVDTRLTAGDLIAFQRRAVPARAVGVGPRLPTDILRALMLVRAAGYAAGGSGASPAMLQALVAALNADRWRPRPGCGPCSPAAAWRSRGPQGAFRIL